MFILGLVFLSLFSNFIIAEENYLDNSIFGVSEEGVTLKSDWKTWGTDFKNKLLENSIVMSIDSFLQKISIVFQVIFGTPYSLSIVFLLTIALWFYALFVLNKLTGIMLFSKLVSSLIAVGITILIAQFGLIAKPINFLIQLFFGENPWYVKVILGLVIVVGLVFVFLFIKQFAKQTAESKKKKKDEENRQKLETSAKVGEEFSKAITKDE